MQQRSVPVAKRAIEKIEIEIGRSLVVIAEPFIDLKKDCSEFNCRNASNVSALYIVRSSWNEFIADNSRASSSIPP